MPEFAYKKWKSKSQKFKLRRSFFDGKLQCPLQQTYKVYPVSEHLLASVASCDYYDVTKVFSQHKG